MVNLFNFDIEKIVHNGSVVLLMKLNNKIIYEYDGTVEWPYIEYTVESPDDEYYRPLNESYSMNDRIHYRSLPEIYPNNPNVTDYNIDYKKVEIICKSGYITDDLTTPLASIDRIKIWFPQNTYAIRFTSDPTSNMYPRITNIIYCDTSKMQSFYYMFTNCEKLTALDLSNWNTSRVTNMDGMFVNCTSLTTLDLSGLDTSNVTNMRSMVSGCTSLTTLDVSGLDVSNVTDMWGMFDGCESLTTLDLTSWDISKTVSANLMFYGCKNLVNILPPKNISTDIDFADCPLNNDSIMSIVNNLAPVTRTTYLTLTETQLNVIDDYNKYLATSKGWTLCTRY